MSKTDTQLHFTRGWRMRLAMEQAGEDAQSMAAKLYVDRQTVGRWLKDQSEPNPILLREFAAICGVDVEWIGSTIWYGADEKITA